MDGIYYSINTHDPRRAEWLYFYEPELHYKGKIKVDSFIFHPESKKYILTLHGGLGGRSYLPDTSILNDLKKGGYNIITYSQRGGGRSRGYISDVIDCRIINVGKHISDMKALKEFFSPDKKISLIASSHGGILANIFLSHYPELTDRALFLSPIINYDDTLNRYLSDYYFAIPLEEYWEDYKAFMRRYLLNRNPENITSKEELEKDTERKIQVLDKKMKRLKREMPRLAKETHLYAQDLSFSKVHDALRDQGIFGLETISKVRIELYTNTTVNNPKALGIFLKDLTGKDFPPETLEYIFDKFIDIELTPRMLERMIVIYLDAIGIEGDARDPKDQDYSSILDEFAFAKYDIMNWILDDFLERKNYYGENWYRLSHSISIYHENHQNRMTSICSSMLPASKHAIDPERAIKLEEYCREVTICPKDGLTPITDYMGVKLREKNPVPSLFIIPTDDRVTYPNATKEFSNLFPNSGYIEVPWNHGLYIIDDPNHRLGSRRITDEEWEPLRTKIKQFFYADDESLRENQK